MRLDKMFSECGVASRSEVARACRKGLVLVNGLPAAKPDLQVDEQTAAVTYCGAPVRYRKFVYLLLNKPSGYISATEDGSDPVVTDLLPPEYRRMGVFPCGRLDKYTVGLMLLTNDGDLSHRLLAPKNHVAKSYRFTCDRPLSESDCRTLEAGVDIGGYCTKPCQMEMASPCEGTITITEGKYHQIKRMLEAVGNKITFLERVSFGGILLPPTLARGEWRELTSEELNLLRNH